MKLLPNVNVEFVHAASSVRSVICDANERSFSPLAECSEVEASGARCSRAVHHLGNCIVVARAHAGSIPRRGGSHGDADDE